LKESSAEVRPASVVTGPDKEHESVSVYEMTSTTISQYFITSISINAFYCCTDAFRGIMGYNFDLNLQAMAAPYFTISTAN